MKTLRHVGMPVVLSAAFAGPCVGQIAPAEQIEPARPALLLVDPEQVPRVEMSWETTDGSRVELEGERRYGVDAQREPLGENVSCYVAVGGSRVVKSAGHPHGAVVRVGFYKIDAPKPFFRGLGADGRVRVRMSNIAFNQPVDVHPETTVQHLKYAIDDLESCGLPGSARDQFTTVDPDETLNDRIRPGEDTRAGGLSGEEGSLGSVSIVREEDGTVTLDAAFAYPVLRHMSDPWQSDLPGTFLEPIHFHIEFEVLPEGAEPLDIEDLRARRRATTEQLEGETPTEAQD